MSFTCASCSGERNTSETPSGANRFARSSKTEKKRELRERSLASAASPPTSAKTIGNGWLSSAAHAYTAAGAADLVPTRAAMAPSEARRLLHVLFRCEILRSGFQRQCSARGLGVGVKAWRSDEENCRERGDDENDFSHCNGPPNFKSPGNAKGAGRAAANQIRDERYSSSSFRCTSRYSA